MQYMFLFFYLQDKTRQLYFNLDTCTSWCYKRITIIYRNLFARQAGAGNIEKSQVQKRPFH